MTVATYTTTLVEIVGQTQTASTSGWSALGGGGAALNAGSTEQFIQGTQCMTKDAFGNNRKGMIYDTGSDQGGSGTDGAYSFWCVFSSVPSLDTKAGAGFDVLIGSSTSAYKHYHVFGSDTFAFGGWFFAAVKEQTTADETTGSPSATVEQTFGVLADAIAAGAPTKGEAIGLDTVREGRHDIIIQFGTGADPEATFDGVLANLETSTNRYGMLVQRQPGGPFDNSGLIQFGTATNAVEFVDRDKVFFLRDHDHVSRNFHTWECNNSSSVITMTNVTLKALGTTSPGRWVTNNDPALTLTTCLFVAMGELGFNAAGIVDSCAFVDCQSVTPAGSDMRGSRFVQNKWNDIAQGQDETNWDNSPATEGSFFGGSSGHAVSDVLTMTNGATITVDAVSSGVVTQFTVTTAPTVPTRVEDGDNITMSSSTGSGNSFVLSAGLDNFEDAASLVWNVATNPDGLLDDCSFTMDDVVSSHAIEFGTSSPLTMTLTNVTFTGYDTRNDVPGSAIWFRRTSGTITLNIVGGTTPSYRTDGATVDIVVDPVSLDVNVKDENKANLQNARVYIKASDGTGPLPFEDPVTMSRVGTTVTVTHGSHGMETGDKISIKGITDETQDNNGVQTITVTGAGSYTYTSAVSGTTTYSGSIKVTWVAIEGLTDANGDISLTKSLTSNQPVAGWIRLSTSTPRYKSFSVGGIIDFTSGLAINVQMIPDE